MMRQNKLFTSIYVAGTGLSIALVMVLFIIFYVKFAPIYPEYNRNRVLTMSTTMKKSKNDENGWICNRGVSYRFVTDYLQKLKHVEAVGALVDRKTDVKATRVGEFKSVPTNLRYVNADFWQVFTFDFLAGRSFSQEELEAVQPVVILAESFANRLFAKSAPVGEKIYFDGKEFTVVGVVKDASNATPFSAGDAYTPITLYAGTAYDETQGHTGNIRAFMLPLEDSGKKVLRNEVLDMINRINRQDTLYTHEFFGQPDNYWVSTFRNGMTDEVGYSVWKLLKNYLFILLALLFIPALNLSGMISNRMDGRMAELGIRRAYGAGNGEIIRQVLWENLLLTIMGGLLGLLLSYIVVWTSSDWVMHLFDNSVASMGKEVKVTFEMLFNPVVFIASLAFCVVLNLLSALVPTVWALRRTIINSIHSKR